jgi:hypothetical protein
MSDSRASVQAFRRPSAAPKILDRRQDGPPDRRALGIAVAMEAVSALCRARYRLGTMLVDEEHGCPVDVEIGDQVRAMVPISPSRTPRRQIRVISVASRVASASGWLAAFRRLLSTIASASALVCKALWTAYNRTAEPCGLLASPTLRP